MFKQIDLPAHALTEIVDCASNFPEVEEIIIFGSRALGNAKTGSDIDLAVCGEKVTDKVISSIHDHLEEETNLPYFFDIVHFDKIENPALRKHITSHGCSIYRRK